MIILFNPDDGAPIQNIFFKGEKYFSREDGQTFKPGMVIQVDEELATFITGLYEFVQEIDAVTAKKLMARSDEEFACDKCDFKTRTKVALEGHNKKHITEDNLSELGIPKIGRLNRKMVNADMQSEIDAEGKKDGLEGEGIVIENQRKTVVMR